MKMNDRQTVRAIQFRAQAALLRVTLSFKTYSC